MIHQAIASATQLEEMPQDDAGFLAVVRAFFDQALTPELRQAGRETLGVHSDIEACKVWHRRLFERGWIAPAWPVAFGGTGWSARQRFLFDRECARQDAPVLGAKVFQSRVRALIWPRSRRGRFEMAIAIWSMAPRSGLRVPITPTGCSPLSAPMTAANANRA